MPEVPKLHGWITPEYAVQMIGELVAFLEKNGIYFMADNEKIGLEFKKCPSTTMNAHNAT